LVSSVRLISQCETMSAWGRRWEYWTSRQQQR
jgi:hypothetical protein